jgi:hypothetical protein
MAYTLNNDYTDITDATSYLPDINEDPFVQSEDPVDSQDTFFEDDRDGAVDADPGTNLSATAFTNGPDDKLKVVDAYGTRGTGTNNSLEGAFKSSPSLFGSMSTGSADIANILRGSLAATLGISGLSKMSLNKKNLINAIGNQFPGNLKSAFNMMSDTMLAAMNIVKSPQGMKILIGNVAQNVASQLLPPDVNDVLALSLTLGYLISNNKSETTHPTNVTNMAVGLVTQSTQYGLVDVFNTLSVAANNNSSNLLSPQVMASATVKLMPHVVDNSSISLLSEMVTANGGAYISSITGTDKHFINKFVQNYKIPKGRSNPDLITDWNSLVNSFNLIDPNWLTYNRNGQVIINAEKITFFSSDLIKVMQMAYAAFTPIVPNVNTLNLASPYSIPDSNYRLLLLAATNMPSDTLTSIKATFPNLYINSNINRQFV